MADTELLSLTEASAPAGTEGIYLVDGSGNSRYLLLSDLKTFINTDPTVVPSSVPLVGARAIRTSTQASSAGDNAFPFQDVGFDTDSFWSFGSPTRLTIPANVVKAVLTASIHTTGGSAGSVSLSIKKNGADYVATQAANSGFATVSLNVTTGPIIVAENDYFELEYNVGSGRTFEVARTFLSITALEVQSP